MRTEASIKNSILATFSMVVRVIIGFVAQKIFIKILNVEYLGVNGLFSNIFTLLSLAELGIGQAIIFNMYKPIANDDKETVKSLLVLYKKAYNIIALVVLIIGCTLIPFINFFVGKTSLELNFTFVYILFLMQCVLSYVLTYKRSILYASQENYIVSMIESIYVIILNVLQLMMLFATKNYYLYLIIKIICILLENVAINNIANKRFPYIQEKNIKILDSETEKNIFERIKATFMHKIGGVVVRGTDNIIISKFLGLGIVGLYSNYYMIFLYVGEIFRQMINALTPSVGNLLAESDEKNVLKVHNKIVFFNFWLATVSATAIFVIIQHFIEAWLGTKYLLSISTVIILVINYYLTIMRSTNDTFFSAAGIWVETKYVPIIEATINIVFSLIFVKLCGLSGVFIGTIISSFALWGYTYPKFIYRKILKKNYLNYLKENLTYLALFFVIAVVTYGLSMTFTISNLWLDVIARGILCLIVPNLILFLIYRKSEEYEYFKNLLKFMLKRKSDKT